MSMRLRQRSHQHLYPKWMKKQSPARQAKERDGNQCVGCQVADRTLILDEEGRPWYILYLHGAHLHPLDPWYQQIEPIEGQRLRAMCPRCHRLYDTYWKLHEAEVNHQRCLHGILRDRWMLERFVTVV